MGSVLKVKALGERFLETLPGVALAFGYGSGVFRQPQLYKEGTQDQPQIDFILAVDDPLQWHRENLTANRRHYAGTSLLGASWVESHARCVLAEIDFVASKIGVGVHFNTLVPFENQMVKYGITSVAALKLDLTSWRYLYLSGRLHKPVLWIKQCEILKPTLLFNRQAALAAALLLSPPRFHKRDLFHRICGLSYSGDIRMNIAEDDSKIDRIVDGSFQQFDALYSSSLQNHMSDLIEPEDAEEDHFRLPVANKHHLLSFLPQPIRETFPDRLRESLPSQEPYEQHLVAVLSRRVAASSRRQAIAGLLSSGVWKSSIYLSHKIKKAFRSVKDDIRVLKRELNNAVNEEDYFRAATLRDEIIDLEEKDPVLNMKKQLAHAIEIEDYKIAAELRDELKQVRKDQFSTALKDGTAVTCKSDLLTRGIRIRVRSFYVDHLSAPAQGKYVFAYQVEITNEGEETVQLKNRSWTIVDGYGKTEFANGSGVIGQQPIMGPGSYFQYMSICPLETPVGTMEGYYEMVVLNRHSQQTFFANIGKFGLDVNMHHQFKD